VLRLPSVICKIPHVNIIFDGIASVMLCYAYLLHTHFDPCLCVVPSSSVWSCLHLCRCVKSKSHCDWRSVSLSWCRAPAGAHDQMFLLAWKLLSCPCGAPSLTRGRVCHLSVIVDSISQLSVVQVFTNLQFLTNFMYNIYKASVSPGSVQQTMPYF
jgi:hypothetical protein